jgi:hypothetical protein
MRASFILGGGLGFVFFTIMAVLLIGEGSYSTFEILASLSLFSAGIFLAFCFIGVFAPLRGIQLIARQDRMLRKDFGREMHKRRVDSYDFSDDDLFVSVKSDRVLVFYRAYIKELSDLREENRILSRITVENRYGKKHKIVGHHESVEKLQSWFRDKP